MKSRNRNLASVVLLSSITALWVSLARSQQPAAPADPTPFVRPTPLCRIESTNPRTVLQKIAESATAEGFTIVQADGSQGYLEATRKSSDLTEKVMVWIERDYLRPMQSVKVFMMYGPYMKVMGNRTDLTRIKLSESRENELIGKFKSEILKLSLS